MITNETTLEPFRRSPSSLLLRTASSLMHGVQLG